MNKFTTIADEFLNTFDGEDIDGKLLKLAKDNGYSKEEQQRIVEEVNVSNFLKKLGSGTHSSNFKLASPILPCATSPREPLELGSLEKQASVNKQSHITADMFDLSKQSNLEFTPILEVNGYSYDDEMNIEGILAKEASQKMSRDSLLKEMSDGSSALKSAEAIALSRDALVKLSNISPEHARGVIASLAENELLKTAEEIAIYSKFNTEDIKNAKLSSLTKESKSSISNAVDTLKGAAMVPIGVAKAVTNAASLAVKHPVITIAGTGAGYVALNSKAGKTNDFRTSMMLNSNEGGN